MKSFVTISRYWKNPKILTTISTEGISLQADLADFVSALKQEIGSVAMTFTQKTFEAKIDSAVLAVLKKIKEESIKVI